jgi:hypothetical protein
VPCFALIVAVPDPVSLPAPNVRVIDPLTVAFPGGEIDPEVVKTFEPGVWPDV